MEFVENPFTATLRLLWEDRLFNFVHFAYLCRYRYGQSGGPENSILNSFALAGHFAVCVECESRGRRSYQRHKQSTRPSLGP